MGGGLTLKLSTNILSSPALVTAAIRNKVTTTKATRIVETVIEEGGGNIESFNLSFCLV